MGSKLAVPQRGGVSAGSEADVRMVSRACKWTAKRGVVPPSALPPPFADRGPAEAWTLDQARRTFEVRFVRAALVRTGGHRSRAAVELGVTRQGLTKLMTRLGILSS